MTFRTDIRSVAKTLLYKDLPEIVGQHVSVMSVETAPLDVLHGLRHMLPGPFSFIGPDNQQGSLAKYGILDLRFTLDGEHHLTLPHVGVRGLKRLGIVVQPDPDEEEWDDGLESVFFLRSSLEKNLKHILRDISQHKVFLKLLLRSQVNLTASEHPQLAAMWELPPGCLPGKFVVERAHLCNAQLPDYSYF